MKEEKSFLNNPLFSFSNIAHSFDYELFNNLSLDINPQESIAITGTSGSGKSTLLNILSSLLKPNQGKVIYNNYDIYKLNKKELLEIRRKDFGIIFQEHFLFRGFNTLENIAIAELLLGSSVDKELLKELKIDHILNNAISEISGGQQQRVSIARVLTKKPKVIFADEPTGNLDKTTANEVMDILFKYIKQNNAILIMVTHDHNLANKCDRVFELNNCTLEELK
jgi:putative ABC transport system ATP-binding protein